MGINAVQRRVQRLPLYKSNDFCRRWCRSGVEWMQLNIFFILIGFGTAPFQERRRRREREHIPQLQIEIGPASTFVAIDNAEQFSTAEFKWRFRNIFFSVCFINQLNNSNSIGKHIPIESPKCNCIPKKNLVRSAIAQCGHHMGARKRKQQRNWPTTKWRRRMRFATHLMVSFRFFGRDSSWTEFREANAHRHRRHTLPVDRTSCWFLRILRDGIFARFSSTDLLFLVIPIRRLSPIHIHSSSLFFPAWIPVFYVVLNARARVLHVYSSHTLSNARDYYCRRRRRPIMSNMNWMSDSVRQRFIAHMQWNESYRYLLLLFCFMNAWPDIDRRIATTFMSALLLCFCMMSN